MQNSARRKSLAKTERFDPRPALAITAISAFVSLLVAVQLLL